LAPSEAEFNRGVFGIGGEGFLVDFDGFGEMRLGGGDFLGIGGLDRGGEGDLRGLRSEPELGGFFSVPAAPDFYGISVTDFARVCHGMGAGELVKEFAVGGVGLEIFSEVLEESIEGDVLEFWLKIPAVGWEAVKEGEEKDEEDFFHGMKNRRRVAKSCQKMVK